MYQAVFGSFLRCRSSGIYRESIDKASDVTQPSIEVGPFNEAVYARATTNGGLKSKRATSSETGIFLNVATSFNWLEIAACRLHQ